MENNIATRQVYVPNKGGHDYTEAWKFGDLVFLTEGFVNRKDFATMYAEISKGMDDCQIDDFIMLTSLASLCSITCAIFAHRFGCLNLLVFEDGQYIERHLTLEM